MECRAVPSGWHDGPMTVTNVGSGLGSGGPVGGPQPLAIQLNGVHKRFGSVEAVKGIELNVASGEIVAFLGPNGAGKTTTIDMVLGLSQPTVGRVSVFGMQPRQAIARGLVSAVMQTGGLLRTSRLRRPPATRRACSRTRKPWTRSCTVRASLP